MANEREAPPLYRAGLLRRAAEQRAEKEHLNANGTRDYRGLSETVGLSVNTIRQAIDGRAVKLDVLYKLASHFEIDWLELFDVQRELESLRPKAKPAGRKK